MRIEGATGHDGKAEERSVTFIWASGGLVVVFINIVKRVGRKLLTWFLDVFC